MLEYADRSYFGEQIVDKNRSEKKLDIIMIIVGVVFYILPMAADCITAGIGSLNIMMQKWLIS